MDITVTELKTKLDNKEDFLFIDGREEHEYEEFNIGARLIPMGSIQEKLPELEPHKDKEIVVHCRSGQRSGMIQRFLQSQGFNHVRNLTGGVLAWQEEFGA